MSASTGSFTCGLTRGGAAYCWGAKDQLGTGSREQSSVPVAVAGGHSFSALSTGHDHACALTANGTAYCWGYNQFDQLGTGPGGGPQFCDAFPCSTAPTAVSGGLTFAAVSASTGALGFTCSLTPGGAAYCWGDNGGGELGNGTTTNSSTPLAVEGGFTFAAVTTGEFSGPIQWRRTMSKRWKRQAALTLTELLCVMAILLILAALYLPAILRAYKRVRAFLGGI